MPYDDEHHCLFFLPDGRLAVSTGAQADMALAGVAILNADTGAEEGRYERQVTTSHNSFSAGVLALAPHGKLIALAGHYPGLVIFALVSGANVAARFSQPPFHFAVSPVLQRPIRGGVDAVWPPGCRGLEGGRGGL